MERRISGFSILVVEDDPRLRAMLRRVLTGSGWQVHLADDGVDALAALASLSPDVVLSDVDMPRMDGLALGRTLRETHPTVPVVFMSGNPETQTGDLSPYFVSKPFCLESLDRELIRAARDAFARKVAAS